MIGFSWNPEDGKFIYIKPGGGFQRSYGEQQGLEKLVQFLKEKRYESRGDSRNGGLVLTTQTSGELATWDKFVKFHKGVGREVDELVAGYGVLDLFVDDSLGAVSYVGPALNREQDKAFYTWETSSRDQRLENMASTRASAVYKILEDFLQGQPDYENFVKQHCFPSTDSRYTE